MSWLAKLAAWVAVAYLLGRYTMGVVSAKEGVNLNGLAPEGYVILGAIERATRVYNVNLIITSASRPDDADSQHSLGKAIDVRTSNLTAQQILSLYWWFKVELGSAFVVLFETNNAAALPAELRAIAFTNQNASAPHFHFGAKRT